MPPEGAGWRADRTLDSQLWSHFSRRSSTCQPVERLRTSKLATRCGGSVPRFASCSLACLKTVDVGTVFSATPKPRVSKVLQTTPHKVLLHLGIPYTAWLSRNYIVILIGRTDVSSYGDCSGRG